MRRAEVFVILLILYLMFRARCNLQIYNKKRHDTYILLAIVIFIQSQYSTHFSTILISVQHKIFHHSRSTRKSESSHLSFYHS